MRSRERKKKKDWHEFFFYNTYNKNNISKCYILVEIELALIELVFAIDTHELVLRDLFVQESLELIDSAVPAIVHEKSEEHRVDSLEGQGLEVGEHPLYVQPQALQPTDKPSKCGGIKKKAV